MDWNNDGKKDLVLGEAEGFIRIYLNTHTDADPVFTGFTYLKIGSQRFDCGTDSDIFIVDWNNDGKKDVLSGDLDLGKVVLLLNVGTHAAPIFSSKHFIQDGGHDLATPSGGSSPRVVDWNGDGKKDLFVGDENGFLCYFKNIGSDVDPLFDGYTKIEAGGQILDVDLSCRPETVDWDNDGVLDVVCGSMKAFSMTDYKGYVWYFHGIGPLSLSDNRLFESTGVSIDLALNAGSIHGNRNYLILGSVTGTEPGIPLPGGHATLPLNWDSFTDLVLSLANTPVFSNFMGQLDANGEAAAQLNAPPLPGYAGLVMHFAYCLNNFFDYVSNPAAIEVVP